MPQYEVQPGDTLYDIAQKTTGDGNRWREIYDNNKTTIGSDPGMIHAGQVYSIPYDQAAVNEGNSMGYGSQSQGDYPAPSIQPYNSQRYPDPNKPSPDTSSYSSPSSGANISQPQNTPMAPATARSLTKPPQGPSPYTPQMSADNAFQQLPPREQMAKQVAPDQRAQMGVQITPPLQQSLNDWQQRLERNQRLGVPDTSPSPQVHPLQAQPAQGYGPGGGSAGPQSNQQMVQWPAPPNPVGPQSYQGRFQDNTGAPRTIDAYHGYMGKPFEGSSQPQRSLFAGSNTGRGGYQDPGAPPVTQMPQRNPQQAQPRAVIVIQADGSSMVYDPSTGQWSSR